VIVEALGLERRSVFL